MVITFFVQGRPDGEAIPPSEQSYFDSVSTWVQDKAATIYECSFDDALSSLKEYGKNAWNKSIVAFKYLTGDPLPPPLPVPQQFHNEVKKNSGSAWSFAGIFSSLKGQRGSSPETPSKSLTGKKFTEGEVHADLVKVSLCMRSRVGEAHNVLLQNKDGYFVFRYLLVDLPSALNVFLVLLCNLFNLQARDTPIQDEFS